MPQLVIVKNTNIKNVTNIIWTWVPKHIWSAHDPIYEFNFKLLKMNFCWLNMKVISVLMVDETGPIIPESEVMKEKSSNAVYVHVYGI